MPKGETYKGTVNWPSKEFAEVYADVCARLDTKTRNERLLRHAMADIERDGTEDEIQLARDHMAGRARRGPKPREDG